MRKPNRRSRKHTPHAFFAAVRTACVRISSHCAVSIAISLAVIAWVLFEWYISLRESYQSLPHIGVFRGDGTSMEPVITSPGFVVYHPFHSYDVGDVIIFESDDTYVVHRIVQQTPEGFLTKGDGNAYDDRADHGLITEDDILGGVRFAVSEVGFGNPNVRV